MKRLFTGFTLMTVLTFLGTRSNAQIVNDTVSAGSIIIDMGVTPQTFENGLKPYGLVFDLVETYQVPVVWVIKPGKQFGDVDFTHNGRSYKGGPFVVPWEYRTPAVDAAMASWAALGVELDTTISEVAVPANAYFSGFNNLVIDQQNENLVIPYFENAEIPTSYYSVGLPSDLDMCSDVYVMPHADPEWSTHSYLYSFNRDYIGYIWGGCHAVSVLEGLADDYVNPTMRTNFLTTDGLQCFGNNKCGDLITESHGNATEPFTTDWTFGDDRMMQFLDDMTPSQDNGSEQWYIPLDAGAWNPGVRVGVTTSDVNSNGDVGAKQVYGRGYDDPYNGMVMYQGGHSADGKGTEQSQVAFERSFFDFIFAAAVDSVKLVKLYASIPNTYQAGDTVTVQIDSVVGGIAPYTYTWSTTCDGSFGDVNASTTSFAIGTTQSSNCLVTCVVVDACGRRNFVSIPVSIIDIQVAGAIDVTCFGANDGSIDLTVSSGTPPYTFDWSNGATTEDISGLAPGVYTITVTDANGFSLSESFTISEPDPLVVDVAVTEVNCLSDSSGSVDITVTGGTPPVGYLWSTGDTVADLTDLYVGSYALSVVDTNGCTVDTVIAVGHENCPPTANNDFNNTLVDLPVSGNVLTNDWDFNGDNITVSGPPVTGPSNGSVTLNSDGSYTYTPNSSYQGEDTFTYSVCDDGTPTMCDTATVFIEVIPITSGNEPPIANADVAQTLVNVPVPGNVLVNDGDPDGDNIILNTTPITLPTNGTVTLNSDGSFTYVPNTDFIGTDTYIYSICDDATPSLCDTAVVTINVIADPGPSNDPPFAADDAALTPQEVPVSGNLLTNDFDPNGDNIIINTTPVSGPTNGSVFVTSTGSYTYTPDPGFTGTDQFVYQICDDGTPSMCAQATCYITVYPDNNPPVATDDINSTLVDVPVTGNVSTNDWDPDGDDLTVNTTLLTDPSNGSVTILSNGNYTYTPNSGFSGEDTFEYVTCDNGIPSLCDTALVSIQVVPITTGNEPPVAQDDAVQTYVDVPVTGNVLVNDDDPDGDNIILNTTPVTSPSHGSVTMNSDGSFTYTPDSGYDGTDVFTYSICDDATPSLCDTAQVTVVVVPNYNGPDNDPPFAGDDAALTPQEVPVSGNLLTNDYDPNGDNITITTSPISGPSHGAVVINTDGTYTYTPTSGYTGPDHFVYKICDDGTPSLCAFATCYITVYPDNNPPTAVNDFNNTLVDTPVSGNVLTNDSDPDGDNLTVNTTLVSGPSNGSVTMNTDGTYTYTPSSGYEGMDTFVYEVCDDGVPSLCSEATVTIWVIPVTNDNDPPVANPDAYVTQVNVPVGGNITDNDDDPDGDNLTLTTTPISGPANGTVTISSNGDIVYTPDTDFVGNDTLTYRICDDGTPVLCDEAIVTITVLPDYNGPDNDPPFAGDDAALTPKNVPVSGQLLTNDFDPNGDNITINTTPVSGPSHGTVVVNSDGSYTYTPTTGYVGPDQYVYQICDDGTPSLCATATCYITVFPGPTVTYTITEPVCNGENNGSINITVTNASQPITYSWSNGATTEDLNNVVAGTYVVTVTDGQGSVVQQTIELTQPSVLGVSVDVQDETIVNGCNGSATANPTGGTSPYTYLWSNGQTTQTATGLCAAIYTVTITDAKGCEVTTSRVINPPSCDLDVNVTGQPVTCNGASTGSVLATPVTQQNNTPFTYVWSNGGSTQQITGVAAGPYSVSVTDSIGCNATGSFTVTEPALLGVTTSVVDELTFNGCDGSATATASGGTSPYLYSWSDGQIGQTASNLCPGNYTVTITDAQGCSTSKIITVNALSCSGFSVTVNTYNLNCFNSADGSAVAVVSGGTAPFTYFWTTGGATVDSLSSLGAGTYTVQVTDSLNCQQTASGVITQPSVLQAVTAADPVTCHGLANGAIELTVTGGTTPYSYTWSNAATTEDLNNLGPGTYGVSILDAHGCTTNASGTVTEPDTLGATSVNTNVACYGASTGAIDLTATGGLPPYNYSWSNGQTTQDISGLAAGSYTLTFADQNACVFVYSTTITEDSLFVPTITADGPTTFCAGDSVTLTATAGTSYLWSTGATTQSIVVYASGIYSVAVVSADGCSGDSDPVQVTVNSTPTPTVNPIGPTTFCQGGSVTLTTGSYDSYLWSTGDTTQSVTVSTSGTYSVTVTDANGCVGASGSVTVTVNPLPTPTIDADGPLTFCQGDSVLLTASSAASWQWSNGANTQTITVTTAGVYAVTVTDVNGCSGASDSVTVVVNSNPTPTVTPDGPTTFCDGDSVVLTSSVADTYLWSTGATTQSVTVYSSGTYTVTVTDVNGCSGASAPITVTVNSNPTPTITASGGLEFCDGDSVILTSSVASSYLWSTGATTRAITVYASGDYYVTATLATGCSGTSDTVTVTVNPNPTPSITVNGPTTFCQGGSVDLTVSSASSYVWNTGATAQTITVTTSGQRWVTVTNSSGCSGISDTINVVVNPNPTPTISADGPLEFCDGDSVTLTASAGAAYLWSTGATTQSIVVYNSGSYTVTVTDANGCSGTSAPTTVVVNQLPFSFIFATGPTTFCEGDSVDLVARQSAGYLWNTGDTTRIITVDTSGTYSVTVFDVNGCQSESNEITVTVNPNPTPTITADGPLAFCDGDNVTLEVPGSSVLISSYTWNTGELTQSILVDAEGSYYATVTNVYGCSGNTDTVDVEVWPLPQPEVTTIGTPSFCLGDTIWLTTTEEFESYLWTNTGDTTRTTYAVQSGFYTVLVTDTNGCQGLSPEDLITLNVNPTPTTNPDGTVEICQGDTISITSVMAESYLWNTGDTTQVIYVWQAGTYNVSATDQNGCVGTSSDVIVVVNQLPTPTIVADDTTAFCLGGTVGLSTQDYLTYSWSNGANTQSTIVNQTGTYTVTVTDSAGCAAAAASIDVTVYQPPTVSINIIGPQQFCFGDSAILTATSGYSSYLWSNGATTHSITVHTSGTYNVTVTDQNGCQSTSSLTTIEVYPIPNVDIIANGPTEFCQGDSVVLTAIGGMNYHWSNGAFGPTITVFSPGSYYVTGSNSFGCEDVSASVSITVNQPPTVFALPNGPTDFCQGGSVDLFASGADSYLWSTGQTTPSITVTSAGSYSVIGFDANGCSSESGSVAVTQYPDPVPTVTASGPTQFCDGDSVVLTASGADAYDWSTGETTQSITVFTSGSYQVSVVDSNGCGGTSARVIVDVWANPTPTITPDGPTEFCDGDSVVLAAPTGFEEYLWSTGDTTEAIVVLASGTFNVMVTDEGGCSGVSPDVTVTVNTNPQPQISASDTVVCDGQIVTLTSTQFAGYDWSTGANTQQIAVTVSGIYSVEVTDANGCMGMDSIEITVNPTPTPIPVITPDGPTTFCDGDSVTLMVDTWNSYFWTPTGDTTQNITVGESGTYIVIVTNQYGCDAAAAGVTVTVNPVPVPTIQSTGNGMLCAGESITLNTGLYNSYQWSSGESTQSIDVDTTGLYNVTVTNSFGCAGTSEDFEVIQNPLPEISIDAGGSTTICTGSEMTLTAVGNGPYLWSTGETTQTITVSQGTYFVQATDTVTGCTGVSDDVVIDFFPDSVPDITVDGPTAFCDGGEVVLTATEGLSYLWSPTGDTTQSITVSTSGVYHVTVVDTNGCSGTSDDVTVTVLPTPQTQIVPSSQFPYCEGDMVTLTAAGVPFIDDFEWNNGETTQSIEVTQSSVYTVVVTNPAGCSATASLPIGFLPLPPHDINVDGDPSICEGDEVTLTVSGLPFGNDYVWSNGETTQSITVSESGTYSVIVTSVTGCSAESDPVTIDVVPGPTADVSAMPDTAVCVGDTVTLEAMGGQNYIWSSGDTTSSITFVATQDVTYSVQVTNDGCDQKASDEVSIVVQEYPVAGFIVGDTNLGEPVEFTDTSMTPPFYSWSWDFGDGNSSGEPSPSHDYEAPGDYTVTLTVSTSAGCMDVASQDITVTELFIITNVLTPNGDDINDYIWITSSLAKQIDAKVYNRWGFSVWEATGTDLRFAGKTSEGVDLNAGTYFYTIVLDYGDSGLRELTGYITLIR